MEISEHSRRYWQYEYDVVSRYMLPLMKRWGVSIGGASVLDVGCGEGGGMCAMSDAGARICGFDIDELRIEIAKELMGPRNIPVTAGDMYAPDRPFTGKTFDIVVLHDVFEHLEDKAETLRQLVTYLAPGGVLFMTFPPYFSAFGAHQQTLSTPYLRIPFVHLVPFVVSTLLPRIPTESQFAVREVQKLARMKMGMSGFERIIKRGNLHVAAMRAYLIGPNHIRFGLTPVSAGMIGRIPIVREFLASGVVYLLKREEGEHAAA